MLIDLLSVERQEILILTILQRYFLTLWKLSEADLSQNKFSIAGKMGISPYFLDDYLSSLRKYQPPAIASSLAALMEADELLKSSGSDNLFVMINTLRKIVQS